MLIVNRIGITTALIDYVVIVTSRKKMVLSCVVDEQKLYMQITVTNLIEKCTTNSNGKQINRIKKMKNEF